MKTWSTLFKGNNKTKWRRTDQNKRSKPKINNNVKNHDT